MSRYFPGFATQADRSTKGYAKSGSGGMTGGRSGPSALESGHGSSMARSKARRGSSGDGAGSIDGSEVELANSKSNPFEVHVVHELSMGVESGPGVQAHGHMGVMGYISPGPAAPERTRSKVPMGGM